MGLSDTVKNHIIVIVASAFAAGAGLGWTVSQAVRVMPRDEEIARLDKVINSTAPSTATSEAGSVSRPANTESESIIADAPTPRTGFDFEEGSKGWRCQDLEQIKGCSSVASTADQHRSGNQSLEIILSINGADPTGNRGEALAPIANVDALGKEVPLNLSGRTISAWIYSPQGSAGPSDNPNGLQLFVKDSQFRSLYGPWFKVVEGGWVPVRIKVSTIAEDTGHVNDGFDPTHLVVFGVKFAAGGNSPAIYKGSIYVDDIDW